MDTLETTTTKPTSSPAPAEPGHLHFDRASRGWLSHDPDGTLHPYAGRTRTDSPDGRDDHAVAA